MVEHELPQHGQVGLAATKLKLEGGQAKPGGPRGGGVGALQGGVLLGRLRGENNEISKLNLSKLKENGEGNLPATGSQDL